MPRKTRARGTAAKMAQYKKAADSARALESSEITQAKQPLKKKSPKTKSSTPPPGVAVLTSVKEKSVNLEPNEEDGMGLDDGCVEMLSVSSPALDSELLKKTSLQDLAEIPETPVRAATPGGRRRIVAPMRGSDGYEMGLRKGQDLTEINDADFDRPSKKRRAFVTPPRSSGIAAEVPQAQPVEPNVRMPPGQVQQSAMAKNFSNFQELPDYNAVDDLDPPLPAGKTWNGKMDVSQVRERGIPLRERLDQANGNVDLHTITTSSATLSLMFERFQKALLKEVEQKHLKERSELQKIMEKYTSGVMKELRSFQSVLEMLSNSQSKKSTYGKSSSKVSLAEWEKKLDELTPHVKIIFSTDVISRILAFNAPLKTVSLYGVQGGSDVERASEAVQTLLFCLQPGEKKQMYSDGIGMHHSSMMFTVVQNLFFNVCKDTFGMFTADQDSSFAMGSPTTTGSRSVGTEEEGLVVSTNCSLGGEDKGRIFQPFWVRPGYVTVEHIETARAFREQPNQSRKRRIRNTPTVSDIASHGALRVYREVSSHLHQSREHVRASFFEALGYLMVPWKLHVNDTNQNSLKMELLKGSTEEEFDLNVDEIPLTSVCRINADISTANLADTANKKLLKRVFLEWESMIVVVSHDVHVINGSSTQRKHSGGERTTIRKLIHLIDVACEICVQYCRVESIEVFLRSHPLSLQCVMIFALLFKALVIEFMEVCGGEVDTIPDPKDVAVHVTCLKDLMPGQQSQQKLLCSRCLRLTQKEFEILNHPLRDAGATRTGGLQDELTVGAKIEESAALGIATI